MKRDLSLPEEKPLKAVPYPRGFENKFERLMQDMTKAIAQQYENETFKKLNKKTIDKFEDAQVGNWARIFTTLSNKAKAKIRKRFNKSRIREKVTQILAGLNRANQSAVFENVEKVVGISAKELIAKEGLKPQTNALIEESIEWVNRNLDETLADFSANSLRLMAEGQPVEEVLGGFKIIAGKRVESSKFVARNQIANFNSFNNKIRYQNLGITEAIWVTAHDERVRPSHQDREGKTFEIDEGLFSSVDGKTLLPGVDYNCFPGDTLVSSPCGIEKIFRHFFTGELSKIITSDNSISKSTPNHQFLTTRGWVAAKNIKVGDYIVNTSNKRINTSEANTDKMITFEDLFASLYLLLPIESAKGLASDFHGDIAENEEINIISLECELLNKIDASISKNFSDSNLASILSIEILLSGDGIFDITRGRPRRSSDSLIGTFCEFLPILKACMLHSIKHRLGSVAGMNFTSNQKILNRFSVTADRLRNSLDALPIEIISDDRFLTEWLCTMVSSFMLNKSVTEFSHLNAEVIATAFEGGGDLPKVGATDIKGYCRVDEIGSEFFAGHVYNLQSNTGWYTIHRDLIIHNCRCIMKAIIPGDDDD